MRVPAAVFALLVLASPALLAGCFGATVAPCAGYARHVVQDTAMTHNVSEDPGVIHPGDLLCLEPFPPARPQGGFSDDVKLQMQAPQTPGYGDIVVFHPDGDENRTALTRIISWVVVSGEAHRRSYVIFGPEMKLTAASPHGIYYPPYGFNETNGFTPNAGWKPESPGYVTRGDNVTGSFALDQALGRFGPVTHDHVIGRVVSMCDRISDATDDSAYKCTRD